MIRIQALVTSAAILSVATLAFAGGHSGNPVVKARKAHMQLYGHNLGLLGAMAKGEAEYNAEAATAAANNMVALTSMSQMSYWPAGTSSDDLPDESRALPAIWEDGGFAKAVEINTAMAAAAVQLAAVAGDGQAALGPALGGVGQQCGACHDDFRKPR